MMAAARMFGVDCAFANAVTTDALASDGRNDATRRKVAICR